MNKENPNIDNGLKEKFDHHDFGAPPDDFLADINRRLDEDEESDRFIWWILDGTIILCFLSLLFYGQINQKNKVYLVQQTTKKHESAIPEKVERSAQKDEKRIPENDAVQENTQHNPNNDLLPEKAVDTQQERSASLGQPIKKQTDKNFAKQALHNDQEEQLKSETESSVDKHQVVDVSKNKTEKTKHTSTRKHEKVSNIEKKKSPKKEWGKTEFFAQKSHDKFDVYATEYALVDRRIKDNDFILKNNFSERQETANKNTSNDKTPNISTASVGNETLVIIKNNFFEIQAFGGVAYGWPKTAKSFSDEYTNQLKAGLDKDELSPNFGINFNFVRKRIVIGTGVQYFHFDEEIEHKEIQTTTTDSIYISGNKWIYNYDSLGYPIDSFYVSVYDTIQNVDKTDKSFEIEQRYSWISIPIQIGYRFSLGKNWAITPSVGGSIALGFRRKTVQFPSYDFNQLEEYQSVKWMLSLQANVEVRRKIKNWHIFFKAGYHFGLTPYINSNSLQRKYSQVNGVFGVGYTF